MCGISWTQEITFACTLGEVLKWIGWLLTAFSFKAGRMESLLRTILHLLLLWTSLTSVFCNNASYRLPLEVIPVSYNIQLVPYLNEGLPKRQFTFDGIVSIVVQAKRPLNTITLHAKDIKLKGKPTLTKVDSGDVIEIHNVSQEILRDFMILNLDKPLCRSDLYQMDIKYRGYLTDSAGGFYRINYMDRGYKRWIAATQFEPTKARTAFPCFDEPALKANFTICIARHSYTTTISNMPLLKTSGPDSSLNGRLWDVFETTVKMSTYLVAFVVADFKSIKAGSFSVWSIPSSVCSANFALQVSPDLLEAMENFTHLPFQLPKIDEVALPGNTVGAMENWGLIIYGERNLLLLDESASQKQRIVTIIAHEFAHQWFGNLVTLHWWNYTWLNEGFASYFQYHAADKIFPEWRLTEQQVILSQFSAMFLDSECTVKALTRNVETPADIQDTFSKLYYDKGASIVKMMAHVLTDETFYKGLRTYLRSSAYSDAVDDDLYFNLQQAADEDGALLYGLTVKCIMNSWTRQRGYPVVSVIRDYKEGTVMISQERFLRNRNSATDSSKWYISLTYTSSSELDFKNTKPRLWLTPQENLTSLNFEAEDQWIIFNIQASGYYRVNYDVHNWNLLQAQLCSERFMKIHPLNRAQLLDDVQNLLDAGLLLPGTTMGITSYLERETDLIPWLAAFKGLKKMFAKFGGSLGFCAFQQFYLRLMDRLCQTITFDPEAGESHLVALTRPQVVSWACVLGHYDCLMISANKVQTGSRLNSEFRKAVYCGAVRHDGELSWNILWKEYIGCIDVKKRQELLSALGCTCNITLINRLLYLTVTEGSRLKPEDRLNVFPAACNGQYAVSCDVTLDFIGAHFIQLARLFGEFESIATILLRIAPNIKTREQLEWMLIIASKHETTIRSTDPIIRSAVKIVEENLKWLETTGNKITSWITCHGYM